MTPREKAIKIFEKTVKILDENSAKDLVPTILTQCQEKFGLSQEDANDLYIELRHNR